MSYVALGRLLPSLGTDPPSVGGKMSPIHQLAVSLGTSHFALLEPQFPSFKLGHISLAGAEGSPEGSRGQGGDGAAGGSTRGR